MHKNYCPPFTYTYIHTDVGTTKSIAVGIMNSGLKDKRDSMENVNHCQIPAIFSQFVKSETNP